MIGTVAVRRRLPLAVAALLLAAAPSFAQPPVPTPPTASCGAVVDGRCIVGGAFTLSAFSSGAHHYRVCRSADTTGWGGCNVVMSTDAGSSFTVSGADVPSHGFRRAYYFSACDAAGACTRWADNPETYVYADTVGPSAAGPTTTACKFQQSGCWVTGGFTVSVAPAVDADSAVSHYRICRSHDSTGGHAGCQSVMAVNGGTSYFVTETDLPADGFRRSYWFQPYDVVGNQGPWNDALYVRVDRHAPTVSASNASSSWFGERTAMVSADDTVGGAAANSGLAETRYRWNLLHNLSCTTGTPVVPGTAIEVPPGSNTLFLCARDNTGRVGTWNGGPYRVDATAPVQESLTTSSTAWTLGIGKTYTVTASVRDAESGLREVRALINYQGSNSGNRRGFFSWRDQTLGFQWAADQVACAGGGWASKHPTSHNPETVTLVGCASARSGDRTTITFTLRPETSFGAFGPINDVSLWVRDFALNIAGWTTYDTNFSTVFAAASDAAELVSVSFPSSLSCGATGTASVTMRNAGFSPWTAGDSYRLGAVGNSDPFTAANRVMIPPGVSVAPGQSHTFTWPLTAPTSEGSYVSDWRMVRESVHWFGPTAAATISVTCPQDFAVSVAPASQNLPRRRSKTFTVSVSASNGYSSPVALGASSLPPGVTAAFSPTTVAPGGTSTLTLTASSSATLGPDVFTVTGSGGGLVRSTTATIDVIQFAPTATEVSPADIPHGAITDVTVTGTDLMEAAVSIATVASEDSQTGRVFPTAQLLSVSADGRTMKVRVDARAAGVDGFYNLSIATPGGGAGAAVRVVGPAPVIDLFSPSQPVPGSLHVLAIAGANLQGAEVVPIGSGIQVIDLDNSQHDTLVGLLWVPPDVPASSTLSVQTPGGRRDLPLEPFVQSSTGALATHALPLDTDGSEALEVLFQQPRFLLREEGGGGGEGLRRMAEAGLVNTAGGLFDLCFIGYFTRRYEFAGVQLSLFDELDQPVTQAILNALVPGETLRLFPTVIAISGHFDLLFFFEICEGFTTDLGFCAGAELNIMIPGIGGESFRFDFCLGEPSARFPLPPEGEVTGIDWSSSDACVTAQDVGGLSNGVYDPESTVGSRAVDITVHCCNPTELTASYEAGWVQRWFQRLFRRDRKLATNPACSLSAKEKDWVEALFLGTGPLGIGGCPSGNGKFSGFPFGSTLDILMAENVPHERRDFITAALPDVGSVTGGQIRAGTVQVVGEDVPVPLTNQIAIMENDNPPSVHQGCFDRGCTIVTWTNNFTRETFASAQIVIPPWQDLQAWTHDTIGHGMLGLCHIDELASGEGPGGSLMGSHAVGSGELPPSLSALDRKAISAVFRSGLPLGATRNDFVAAGLVNP